MNGLACWEARKTIFKEAAEAEVRFTDMAPEKRREVAHAKALELLGLRPEDFEALVKIEAAMTVPEYLRAPTIGRIVHYQRYGSPGGEHKAEPSPAIVTQVLDAETWKCQLFVMNPNGVYFNATEYSCDPAPGCWSWPSRAQTGAIPYEAPKDPQASPA